MKKDLYRDVDFKENLRTYLKFAKPYKWLFVLVIFLATLLELIAVSEKYLFKLILDDGGEFIAGNKIANKGNLGVVNIEQVAPTIMKLLEIPTPNDLTVKSLEVFK